MVLASTLESLKSREISILAIFEVFFAVVVYWGIAVYFNIYEHILLSILIAPLLLLSSNKSKEMTLDLFNKRMKLDSTYTTIESLSLTIVFLLILGFIFASLMRIFIDFSLLDGLIYIFMFAFFTISNLLLYAVIYTWLAIFKNLKYGFDSILDNWYYYNMSVDFKQIPELLLGIENYNGLNNYKISSFFEKIKNSDLISLFFIFIIFVIIYPFTIFYRLSIKSTFWFYIPLLFIIKKPNLETSKNIGKFLSEIYETTWVKVRGVLSIITIGAFFITYFEYYSFVVAETPAIGMIALLYLDFSSIELWKIFQLLVALLTIGLFFYANAIRVPSVSNNIPLQNDGDIKIIFYLNSMRNWLSLFYLISAFIFLATYFKIWEYTYVPNFLNRFFTTLLEGIRYVPFS